MINFFAQLTLVAFSMLFPLTILNESSTVILNADVDNINSTFG